MLLKYLSTDIYPPLFIYRWNNKHKSTLHNILLNISCLHIVLNVSATVFILSISYHNYPGGYAMAKLHELEAGEQGK